MEIAALLLFSRQFPTQTSNKDTQTRILHYVFISRRQAVRGPQISWSKMTGYIKSDHLQSFGMNSARLLHG